MPNWEASDATRHTRAANTPKKRRMWRDAANSAMKRGYPEGRAIMQANAVVARAKGSKQYDKQYAGGEVMTPMRRMMPPMKPSGMMGAMGMKMAGKMAGGHYLIRDPMAGLPPGFSGVRRMMAKAGASAGGKGVGN